MFIIDGHHRVNAAIRERVKEIPANVIDISAEQANKRTDEFFEALGNDRSIGG